MIPRERGLRGLSLFSIILFTHKLFYGEKWLHGILGGGHVVLGSCDYLNIPWGLLWFASFPSAILLRGSSSSCSSFNQVEFVCSWYRHGYKWLHEDVFG
jgi:hypothetical protein